MTFHSYPIAIRKEGEQYYAYSDNFLGVYGLGKIMEATKRSILEAMHLYTKYSRRSL
jgi:predicted RNase H-like HicB family nuclease